MGLILNIDTAVEAASACLAKDGETLSVSKNEKQSDHAAWLHAAIKEIGINVIRINGWPGFLKRSFAEIACSVENKTNASAILDALNKKAEWVPDIKGFVAPRVISMIINEAYFALEENVSTKQEINVAMKLGTNYPYGPFEWSEKIGLKNIAALLTELSKTETRYQPAALLLKDANKS